MEAKWPFMLIAFGLILALGLTIAKLEKTTVMNNWTDRRCDIPVMAAASFFKPDNDSRTSGEFAKDNFEFCMKSYVEKFMGLFMSPIQSIFSKQVNIASSGVDGVNTLRQMASTLYDSLLSFLDPYYRKFMVSVYQMNRLVQYFYSAIKRLNAMMVGMLYSGITMFRGMLNTIQFIIKVVLIVCGIMLAIIVILIFVLFPFVPLILSVLGAIVATVVSITMVVAGQFGDIANTADGYKSGFCFANGTTISVIRNGQKLAVDVKDIKIGDELSNDCGKVTAIITMCGKNVTLFSINGVIVSGSHLVLGTDNIWKSVAKDERAVPVQTSSELLYCFNTTSHCIPVISTINNNTITLFRDWEEIDDDDYKGQWLWNYQILSTLNNNSNYSKWKNSLKPGATIPLLGKNTLIKTAQGFVPISTLKITHSTVINKDGKEERILGVICSDVDNCGPHDIKTGKWHTELYEFDNTSNSWIKGKSTIQQHSCGTTEGYSIITESGEFIIFDDTTAKEKIVRDFTDIGYKRIHQTYPLVASRLRLFRPDNN
jgi:hypothetical protein